MLMLRIIFFILLASEMPYTVVMASNDTNTTEASSADTDTATNGNNTVTTTTTTTTTTTVASNTTISNSTTTTPMPTSNFLDMPPIELPCSSDTTACSAYSMPTGGEPSTYGKCASITPEKDEEAECKSAHDIADYICDTMNKKAEEHLAPWVDIHNKHVYNKSSEYTEAHAKFECNAMSDATIGGTSFTTSSGCEWIEDTNNGGMGKCVSAITKPYKSEDRLKSEQDILNGNSYCMKFEPTAEKCETMTYTDLADGGKTKNCAVLTLTEHTAGIMGMYVGLAGGSASESSSMRRSMSNTKSSRISKKEKKLKSIFKNRNKLGSDNINKLRALGGHGGGDHSHDDPLASFSTGSKCVSKTYKQNVLCLAGSGTDETCSAVSSTLCQTQTITMTDDKGVTRTAKVCTAPGSGESIQFDTENRMDAQLLIEHDIACSAGDSGTCSGIQYDEAGQTFPVKEVGATADISVTIDATKLSTCSLGLQLANVYLISIMRTILENMGSFGMNTVYCKDDGTIPAAGGGRCVSRTEPTIDGVPSVVMSGFEFDTANYLFQKKSSGCSRRELKTVTKVLNGNSNRNRKLSFNIDVSINDKVTVSYEETPSAKASAQAAQQSVTNSIGDKATFKTALSATVTEVADALANGDAIPGMPRSSTGTVVSNNALLGDASSGTSLTMDASIASEAKTGAAAMTVNSDLSMSGSGISVGGDAGTSGAQYSKGGVGVVGSMMALVMATVYMM